MRMPIDVIIPVYKPDEKFARLIKGLAAQSLKPEKVIIMYTRAGAGDHFDPSYIEPLKDVCTAEVHELDRSGFDHGGTRAEAAGYSDADIIVMMTMDASPAVFFETGFCIRRDTLTPCSERMPASFASTPGRSVTVRRR